jgi:hypothetical protein
MPTHCLTVRDSARKLTFHDLRKFLTLEQIAGLISDLPSS